MAIQQIRISPFSSAHQGIATKPYLKIELSIAMNPHLGGDVSRKIPFSFSGIFLSQGFGKGNTFLILVMALVG
jgi:hypothetical protein